MNMERVNTDTCVVYNYYSSNTPPTPLKRGACPQRREYPE